MWSRSILNSTFILFTPQTTRWSIVHEGERWLILSTLDALTICGYLPLKIGTRIEGLPNTPRGKIDIHKKTARTCTLSFRGMLDQPNIKPDVRFSIVKTYIGLVNWTEGFFSDGWSNVDSTLSYENVVSIGLRLYLPDSEFLEDKNLDVLHNEILCKQVSLKRGRQTEFTINIPKEAETAGELRFLTNSKEFTPSGSSDIRNLGFIPVEINIDNSGWQPMKKFT